MGVTLPKSGVGAKVTPVGTMRIAWCARAGSTGSEVVGNTYTNQSELHMSNTKKNRMPHKTAGGLMVISNIQIKYFWELLC